MDFRGLSLIAAATAAGGDGIQKLTVGNGLTSSVNPITQAGGTVEVSPVVLADISRVGAKTQFLFSDATSKFTGITEGSFLLLEGTNIKVETNDGLFRTSLPLNVRTNILTGDSVAEGLDKGSGAHNTCYGTSIMNGNSSGVYNVAYGYQIVPDILTGDRNALLGTDISTNKTALSNSIAVGTNILTSTNSICIGNDVGCHAPGSLSIGQNNQNYASRCISIGRDITTEINTHDNHVVIGNKTANVWRPDSTNVCDLGSPEYKFKDVYIEGRLNTLSVTGGKFSQLSTVKVEDTTVITSIVGEGVGSLAFDSFKAGDNYHIRCSGDISTGNTKPELSVTFRLGTVAIHDTLFIPLETISESYVWELEVDFTVINATKIISNSQFVYNKGDTRNDFRGWGSNTQTTIDLRLPYTLFADAEWGEKSALNVLNVRQFLVTKTY